MVTIRTDCNTFCLLKSYIYYYFMTKKIVLTDVQRSGLLLLTVNVRSLLFWLLIVSSINIVSSSTNTKEFATANPFDLCDFESSMMSSGLGSLIFFRELVQMKPFSVIIHQIKDVIYVGFRSA